MTEKLDAIYNPSEFEDKIYSFWLEKKYFHGQIDKSKIP
jgi:valyl-tRNA synthetase